MRSSLTSSLYKVYGGPDLLAPQLAKLCTTTSSPLQVSSTGNRMTIRFKSDAYVSGRGFNASWAEVQGGRCQKLQTRRSLWWTQSGVDHTQCQLLPAAQLVIK